MSPEQFTRVPRTVLIDSAQLESGDGMKDDFKKIAAAEIAAFKQEYRRRNPRTRQIAHPDARDRGSDHRDGRVPAAELARDRG